MIDREHVHRKGTFHRGVHVEVIENDLGVRIPLQLQLDSRILVGEISYVANVGNDLFLNESRNAFDQLGAIDIERNFTDDDLFTSVPGFFDRGLTTNLQAAPASFEILPNPARAVNGASGRKIRTL